MACDSMSYTPLLRLWGSVFYMFDIGLSTIFRSEMTTSHLGGDDMTLRDTQPPICHLQGDNHA